MSTVARSDSASWRRVRLSWLIWAWMAPSEAAGEDPPLHDLDGPDDDQGGEAEPPGLPRRKKPAHRPQHRLGDLPQEHHDGIAGIGADPGDEGRRDDHPRVEPQQPAEEADELRH